MLKPRSVIVIVLIGLALLYFGGREILNIRDVARYGEESRARVIERQVERSTFVTGRRHALEVVEKTYVPEEESSAGSGPLVDVIVLDGHEPIEGRKSDGLLELIRVNSEGHFYIAVAGMCIAGLGALMGVLRKPKKLPPAAPKRGLFRKAA